MSALFQGVAVLFGIMSAACAVMAFVAGYRAVQIGGSRLLFNGIDWFTASDRVPPQAKPHMRSALARWGLAMLCFVLAAATGALSSALA